MDFPKHVTYLDLLNLLFLLSSLPLHSRIPLVVEGLAQEWRLEEEDKLGLVLVLFSDGLLLHDFPLLKPTVPLLSADELLDRVQDVLLQALLVDQVPLAEPRLPKLLPFLRDRSYLILDLRKSIHQVLEDVGVAFESKHLSYCQEVFRPVLRITKEAYAFKENIHFSND